MRSALINIFLHIQRTCCQTAQPNCKVTHNQSGEDSKQAWMIGECRLPLNMGRVCKKSPPKIIVIPPNISLQSCRLCKVQLMASNVNQFCMEHSSQIRSDMFCKTFVRAEFLGMEQMVSSMMSNRILNVEWAVFPLAATMLQCQNKQCTEPQACGSRQCDTMCCTRVFYPHQQHQ